jgi:hypothetical protein
MAPLSQFISPLSWMTALHRYGAPRTQRATAKTSTGAVLEEIVPLTQQIQCHGNILKPPCRVDAFCYQELIAVAEQIYDISGEVVLDLSDLEQIELSGIFALHCIVLISRGEKLPDAEHGWHAMRAAAMESLTAGNQKKLKVLNPRPQIEALLLANHFDCCLAIEHQAR